MKPLLPIIFFLLSLSQGFAQKIDTVSLYNGDKVTCEIINLSKGKLYVKTSDMGKLHIKWGKISSIETLHKFEIVLNDHSVYFGKFNKGMPGSAMVSFGVFQELISLHEITSLVQVNSKFWKQLNGSFDAWLFFYKRKREFAI